MTSPVAPPGGQRAVRAAIRDYIAQGGVPLLGKVFLGPPKRIAGKDAFETPQVGQKSGAACFVHVVRQTRTRVATGGWGQETGQNGGWKFADYEVALPLFYRSFQRDSDAAADDLDALLDGVVALIEADKTLGAPGLILFAAEGNGAAGTIDVVTDLPVMAGSGVVHYWASVNFTVRVMNQT